MQATTAGQRALTGFWRTSSVRTHEILPVNLHVNEWGLSISLIFLLPFEILGRTKFFFELKPGRAPNGQSAAGDRTFEVRDPELEVHQVSGRTWRRVESPFKRLQRSLEGLETQKLQRPLGQQAVGQSGKGCHCCRGHVGLTVFHFCISTGNVQSEHTHVRSNSKAIENAVANLVEVWKSRQKQFSALPTLCSAPFLILVAPMQASRLLQGSSCIWCAFVQLVQADGRYCLYSIS